MTGPERARRVAANERLFESVTEAMRRLEKKPGIDGEPEQYHCECSMEDCTQRIALTRAEYAEARQTPYRFLVIAGHRDPVHETVIRETDHYVLIEKV